MIRNALTRKVFLWISFHFVAVVFTQEPKCPGRYIEERVFEKMIEMDFKLQKTLEKLEKLESQDRDTCNERASRKRVDSQDCSTCLLESTLVLKVSTTEADGWQLIFRASSGNGHSVFDAWTKGENTIDVKPSFMERSYASHYRNNAVTQWSNLGIKYVKFVLYELNREVASVIFNGVGSGMNDWFDKARVTYSTWSDLTATHDYNYFSIAGYIRSGSLDRRFHVNKQYGGCDKDIGHVVVIDTKSSGGCLWDQHPVYPQFLYSKINAADVWNRRQFGRADFMAIFIKT